MRSGPSSRIPVIGALSSVSAGRAVPVTGTGFTDLVTSSDGTWSDSPANIPIFRLRHLASGLELHGMAQGQPRDHDIERVLRERKTDHAREDAHSPGHLS